MDKFINRKREKEGNRKDEKEKGNDKVDVEMLINKCFDYFVEGKNDEFLLGFQQLEDNKMGNNNISKKSDKV